MVFQQICISVSCEGFDSSLRKKQIGVRKVDQCYDIELKSKQ